MTKIDLGKVVPEKGTDYWTEEDKQEIIGALKEMCMLLADHKANETAITDTYADGTTATYYVHVENM